MLISANPYRQGSVLLHVKRAMGFTIFLLCKQPQYCNADAKPHHINSVHFLIGVDIILLLFARSNWYLVMTEKLTQNIELRTYKYCSNRKEVQMCTHLFDCFSLLSFVEFLSRESQPHLNWVLVGARVRLSWVYALIGHTNCSFTSSLSLLFPFIHSQAVIADLRCIGIYFRIMFTGPLEISFSPIAVV